MTLDKRLREIVSREGVDFFGYADLAPAKQAIKESGVPFRLPSQICRPEYRLSDLPRGK